MTQFQMIIDFMEQKVPFNSLLQIKILILREGFCKVRVPWNPSFVGDPDREAVHGGVIASLIDVVGGAAAMTCLDEAQKLSTLNLRIDYFRPGPTKPMLCEAQVVHRSNTVCHVAMKLYAETQELKVIAKGQAIYSLARPKKI